MMKRDREDSIDSSPVKKQGVSDGNIPQSPEALHSGEHPGANIGPWEEHISKKTGKPYWFNPITGQTQWTPPIVHYPPQSPPISSLSSERSEAVPTLVGPQVEAEIGESLIFAFYPH
jgi:hypothetical protein